MYFRDKNDTNIDDEFDSGNGFVSVILNFFRGNKLAFIGLIVLIVIIILILLFVFGRKSRVTYYLMLNGEEIVTVYEDDDYIELGFDAYNSNDVDLTNKVIVKSNLDTSNIGEYEITYTLGDITQIRKVIVVEKPKEYTYIYLNTVEDDVNVYLNVGDEYVEPGFKAISSVGKDITNDVKITGTVDTSKRGNYKLIYSVVDSSDVTVSVSRTVIVMGMDINLSLSTKEYTNEDITIKIDVVDDYFDYMILPDNTKITNSSHSYKVSENGRYTFEIYNKKGISKEATIEVNNIDKEAPTGSCTIEYDSDGSFITIDAEDVSGIRKYDYDGKSYLKNKITLSDKIKEASVTVYDKVGNSKTFDCDVLEEE